MSVDFYVAVPAAEWPSVAAIRQCVRAHHYPVSLTRWPVLGERKPDDSGVLGLVDGAKKFYLEGSLMPATVGLREAKNVVGEIEATSAGSFRFKKNDVLMSMHLRAPSEMRAAAYVISALTVCFKGYAFEPQGPSGGRKDFAKGLVAEVAALKGH